MAKSFGTLEKWRDYFRTANSDIFDIIEHAVMVAATDCPKEFKLRRDKIAEMLFTCKVTRCFGCDKVELAVPLANDDEGKNKNKSEFGGGFEAKESKANSSIDHHIELNVNQVSNYSYGDAEALTEEIEEETQTLGEVLRIKDIIDNSQHESAEVYECLRRLQLMALSVETLKATEIGKSVNALRKHSSKDIRHLSRTLIEDWKVLVDEWVNATAAFTGTESTPESMKVSVVDQEEEGLPSPPLDDLAFFAAQTTSMELSQFFDGMDDDGNPRNSGEFNENRGNGRKSSLDNQNNPVRKKQSADFFDAAPKERKGEQQKKQETVIKKQTPVMRPNKPSGGDSGPGRPIQPASEQKLKMSEMNFQQKSDKGTVQRRPVPTQQNKLRRSDEDAVQVKLEATKRKLQERYQEAENAKRQRTIQVMELHDIPKQGISNQGLGLKNPHTRPGNNNRHWANGRR
ncbi:PREDICTED: probable mediator of RNA polymerase II transcription subunit 26b [Nicotiana attenuata]|uniref:Mediator of rna polymerase ii transcription subunit 26b n=1 Tax=Nicotiana attenuata TaxID=49451 RepID=A0A314KN74_NICAT|nr:PREDICTED: probable mediator of RNA polymerase II transcription subunit 26b [Nicotiana attenuata]OIT30625.1 putative mediator of rna polymerase ii transcription subunit 26b [Nicotiana attenuata]